jgi:hypothetical protein
MAALHLWLGAGGSGVAVAAFAQRWILNYVFLIFLLNYSIRPFSYTNFAVIGQ